MDRLGWFAPVTFPQPHKLGAVLLQPPDAPVPPPIKRPPWFELLVFPQPRKFGAIALIPAAIPDVTGTDRGHQGTLRFGWYAPEFYPTARKLGAAALIPPTAAGIVIPPILLVQQLAYDIGAGVTSVVVTPSTTPTQGDLQVYCRTAAAGEPVIASIVQANCTWTARQVNTVNGIEEIWESVAGVSPGGSFTVTLVAVSTLASRCNYSEWSALATTAEYDAAGSGLHTGTSNSLATASVTPTAGRRGLLIACTRKGGTFSSGPTNGFSALLTSDPGAQFAYLIVDAPGAFAGSYLTSWTWGSSSNYGAAIATFLAPVASTPAFGAEDFSGPGLPPTWATDFFGGTVSIVSGQLNLGSGDAAGEFAALVSPVSDLTLGPASAWVTPPAAPNAFFGGFDLMNTATDINGYEIAFEGGATRHLYGIRYAAGVGTTLFTLPYDPTNHQWVRVRYTAGTIYLETAPTVGFGPGAWTIQASELASTNPAFTPASCVAYIYNAYQPSSADTVILVDAFNSVLAGGNVGSNRGTERGIARGVGRGMVR